MKSGGQKAIDNVLPSPANLDTQPQRIACNHALGFVGEEQNEQIMVKAFVVNFVETRQPFQKTGLTTHIENKTELFLYLADKVVELNVGNKKLFTTIIADHVLTAQACDGLQGEFGHKEADTRMLLHAVHAAGCGHKKLLIRTVDTDVVVLAVSQAQHLNLSKMWVAIGTGKSYLVLARLIVININIIPEKALTLPSFHAFTGCDTSLPMPGKEKKQHGMNGQYAQMSHKYSPLFQMAHRSNI